MSGAATRTVLTAVLMALLSLAACTSTFGLDGSAMQGSDSVAPADPAASRQPSEQDQPSERGEPGDLIRVIDGDSVELDIGGSPVDVRLAAYNAPELYRASSESMDGSSDSKSCNGEAAKAALGDLIGNGPLEVLGHETDRYGRRLADIRVGDGRLVGVEMVKQGWGLTVDRDDEAARERMKQAAADRRGMWGSVCGEPQSTDLSIGETQADPAGSDRDNLNDEWVEIVNRGAASIDLAGWVIRDDTTGHYFPLAGMLESGSIMTVRSGAGQSDDSNFFLGETFPVWSNRAETVLLVDPDGVIAQWAFLD